MSNQLPLSSSKREERNSLAGQVEWLLKQCQFALAVVVARSQPAGMSVEEHAMELACRLRSHEASWEEKARELQREVLRLKQQSLIGMMTSVSRGDSKVAVDADGWWDIWTAGPVTPGADLQPDSGSETPDLPLDVAVPSISRGNHRGHPTVPHLHFLQTLCSLQCVMGGDLWLGPDGSGASVLVDSVCQLLEGVAGAFRDPLSPGVPDLLLKGCQVAVKGIELLCAESLPVAAFSQHLEAALRQMTDALLNLPPRHRTADTLRQCFLILAGCRLCKSFMLRRVLTLLTHLTDQLWLTVQDNRGLDAFPVDQYQNSCHLFIIVEHLLRMWGTAGGVEMEEPDFPGQLERRVFLLADEFPLFSVYMWRIRTLLDSSEGAGPNPGPPAGLVPDITD